MKAFVAHSLELVPSLKHTSKAKKSAVKKSSSYLELFSEIKLLNGSIVKCGITAEEGFARFNLFKELIGMPVNHKMIAFEKCMPESEEVVVLVDTLADAEGLSEFACTPFQNMLVKTGLSENVHFIPGNVGEAIPDYLIENPEEKISLLNIDLPDYESTITALEFLYPRLVQKGLLLLDNYLSNESGRHAIKDYFAPVKVFVHNVEDKQGLHYLRKD